MSALGEWTVEDYLIEGAGRTLTWRDTFIWKNPLDLFVYQEIVREVRPTLIIETGTHMGGSALFWADMMEMHGIEGRVFTVDVEDRGFISDERITYFVGSSVDPEILSQLYWPGHIEEYILVNLDSNHSYPHVSQELEAYAPFVTPGSYLIVEDGIDEIRLKRKGVLSASRNFLAAHPEFEADRSCERYGITNCPEGFLKRKEVVPR